MPMDKQDQCVNLHCILRRRVGFCGATPLSQTAAP